MRGGLKVLSGEDVVAILNRFRFVVTGGTKHLKLKRRAGNVNETLVIPNHDQIAKGTLRAIFVQASHYIPQSELRQHFYNH